MSNYGHARFEVALDELALGIFKLPAQNGSSARIIFTRHTTTPRAGALARRFQTTV